MSLPFAPIPSQIEVPSNEPFRFMMLAMRLLVAAAQLRSDAEIFRSQVCEGS